VPGESLTEDQWDDLLEAIEDGECTPVLGAGASFPLLPLASDIAKAWAAEYKYPLSDTANLARVAQYLAVHRHPDFPKKLLMKCFEERGQPDYDDLRSVHGVLARLPIEVYITTNYDDFLASALRHRRREPQVDYCRWNGMAEVTGRKTPLGDAEFSTSVGRPLVYHLHGHMKDRSSMVLTEEDYLTFLLRVVEVHDLLHSTVRMALAANTVLFIGYSLSDWTFRVLFRGLVDAIKARFGQPAVSIQLPPGDVQPGCEDAAREYLEKFLGKLHNIDVRFYWGDAQSFAMQLHERWVRHVG
jgi:hypothetical protein